jgi:hypothetical protein
MPDSEKQTDEKKDDEVLRRLLKTPPDSKTGKGEKPNKEKSDDDTNRS